MSDAELAATIARLKDERAAIPIPHDVERRRKAKREEIERHEKERNKRYKKKLKTMPDEEVAAAARLNDTVDARTRLEGEGLPPEENAAEDDRKPREKVMTRSMIIAAALVLVTGVRADPLPQPKPAGPGGSCPHGYFTSGSYCVPSQGAQDAVPKPPIVTCPWGWTSSGSFCLRSGR
jgi:hypothetical protein